MCSEGSLVPRLSLFFFNCICLELNYQLQNSFIALEKKRESFLKLHLSNFSLLPPFATL